MNNPVVVLQDVVVFLQTELQGPSLVQSPGLGLVCGVHNCLHHFLLFLQIDRFVCHNLNTNIYILKTSMMSQCYLDDEVLQAGGEESAVVGIDSLLDQVWVKSPSDDSDTNVRRQHRTGPQCRLLRERVEAEKPHEVAEGLR